MRKRSKYRPRKVLLDTMSHVKISMSQVTNLPHQTDLRIKNHSAMAELAQGRANVEHIKVIMAATNITEALVAQSIGAEYRHIFTEGKNALISMVQRAANTHSFICTGPELTAINSLMDLHDAQLDVITVSDLERAIRKVESVINSGGALKINHLIKEHA